MIIREKTSRMGGINAEATVKPLLACILSLSFLKKPFINVAATPAPDKSRRRDMRENNIW